MGPDVSDPTIPNGGGRWRYINEQGIYARPGFSVGEAAIGGLLVPVLLVSVAIFIWLGGQRSPGAT